MSGPRIAVVGLGFMGTRWGRVIGEHHGADLAVVADLRADVGRRVADDLGAEFVADPLEAVSRPDIDGVVVCTPEDGHVDVAITAIGAGKVVAVEKPLAHTVADAERIRDAAQVNGGMVLAGHVLRFEPRYAAIRRAIEADEIGAVQAVRSERIGLVADQDILQGRTSVALYYGVHEFDLARWYAGDVAEVWAARSHGVVAAHGHDVDDLYSVGLSFTSGAHGTAMIGWSLPPRTPGYGIAGFTVIGERGLLRVAQGTTGFQMVLDDGPVDVDVHYSPDVHGQLHGAMGLEVDHFIRCVRGEQEPVCSAADGVEAVRIALAMERAAATHGVVAVHAQRQAERAAPGRTSA
ncbi:MAG: Gfo/Idh/MocA family oxidoreductase [Ilumatobacteraceae bacterium]